MIGFLKAGLALADRITTVSPSYASEIQTPESGMNLDGLLRYRAGELTGILNGIDTQVWDPAADPYIAQSFGPGDIGPRAVNKRALQVRFGLAPDPARLLFGVISRLSWQKGLDLLLDALDDVLALGAQLVVLGSGEREMEQRFTAAAAAHPGQIGAVIGYDEALAHQIQAGIDAILIPSRFEPCGLTQLCALRYGALPIVARTGGLADTIIDANEAALAAGTGTGLQFSQGQLRPALHRAAALWTQPNRWQRLQQNAMRTDVSWQLPARQYAGLYQSLDEKKRLLS
jgi:starch synthase